MAQLDRLGSAKEVAQIGAALGREFSHALLAAVARKPEAEMASALDLVAGLLFRQGVPPHATYLFKHVLVQEAAYGTLLRERRRALHARIAETLEDQFSDIAKRTRSLTPPNRPTTPRPGRRPRAPRAQRPAHRDRPRSRNRSPTEACAKGIGETYRRW